MAHPASSVSAPPAPPAPEVRSAGTRPAVATAATVGALLALSAVVSFWGIGAKSLWRDEGFQVSVSLRSWSSLAHLSIHTDTNGVLYNLALKAWSAFGTGEGALRSLTAVTTVALVGAVYVTGRSLLGTRVALAAAAMTAVHGSVVTYAQQLRAYALSMLVATVASAFFAADVRAPRRWTLAGWVAAVVVLGHTHLVATSLVAAHLVSLLWLAPEHRHVRRRVGAAAVAAVLVAPVAALIATHEEGQGLLSLRPGTFRDILHVMTGRGGIPGFVAFAVLAVVALRLWPGQRDRLGPDRWPLAFAACWTVVPSALLLAVSVVQPMVIGRYLLFTLPGALLWGAAGLVALFGDGRRAAPRPGAVRFGAAALVVVGLLRGTVFWLGDGGVEDWRAASRTVFAQTRPTDGIAFANDSVRLFFEYYRTRAPHAADPVPVYPAHPWGRFETGEHSYLSFTGDDLRIAAPAHDRLWIVIGRKHVNTERVPDALDALAPTHRQADRRVLGDIVVLRFDRRAP